MNFKSIEGYTEKYLHIKKKLCSHIEVFLVCDLLLMNIVYKILPKVKN